MVAFSLQVVKETEVKKVKFISTKSLTRSEWIPGPKVHAL